MATCFRASPVLHAVPSSSSSPKRGSKLNCFAKLNARRSTKIPMPPLNLNDPFLAQIASVAANSPNSLRNHSDSHESLPFADLWDSPTMMAAPAHVERTVSYSRRRSRYPPPDLPSLLLDSRIVYIGMPLVPAVTELIILELMYLQWEDSVSPIHIYINSTGTTTDEGQVVGLETEGFAIYDAMMQLKNEIYTLAMGSANGHACLLLAAGTKGKRFMMPNAKAVIQQPRVPPAGLMAAADVDIRAKEAVINRETFVELLAKHTGNSKEEVFNRIRRPCYMDVERAIEFGVIDKVYEKKVQDKKDKLRQEETSATGTATDLF